MYDIQILPKNSFMPLIEKHLEFMHSHLDDNSSSAFTYMEFEKLRRVVEYMKQTSYSEEKVIEGQIDFWNFFKEQDRRRESNLVASFPELESFLKSCKTLAEKQ